MMQRPLSDALNSATRLGGKMIAELANAAGAERAEAHLRLDASIEIAKELVTRLEVAKTEFAATPLEETTR
jgi:hypothetical protein